MGKKKNSNSQALLEIRLFSSSIVAQIAPFNEAAFMTALNEIKGRFPLKIGLPGLWPNLPP